MASDQKTGGPLGKSSGITNEDIGHGQRIQRSYPLDNQYDGVPNSRGKALRGNHSNIGHSLKGATAVNDSDDLGLASEERHRYIPNH